ncbi:hypothetical protein ACFWIB_43225 [Streptomyces sp. NPDC127051]|uniref:hypothetical protein n=1 Tax=Streptomyces sp. NPDC127051 TaxID=3347119 RepID=UPI00365EAA90
MRHLVIDSFDFADLADHTGPGDDTVFVAVRSGRAADWYGPLAEPVARAVRGLAPVLVGAEATDHEGLQDRLAQAAPRSRAGSWAVGALDCAAWDLHAQAEGCPAAGLLTHEPLQHRITAYSSWLTRDLSHPATADLIAEVSAEAGPSRSGDCATAQASAGERSPTPCTPPRPPSRSRSTPSAPRTCPVDHVRSQMVRAAAVAVPR